MSFYRWSMRYGAAILFVIAILHVVVGMIGVYQAVSAAGERVGYEVGVSDRPAQLLIIVQATLGVLATAALPFFGALVINRFDAWLTDKKQAEPFE